MTFPLVVVPFLLLDGVPQKAVGAIRQAVTLFGIPSVEFLTHDKLSDHRLLFLSITESEIAKEKHLLSLIIKISFLES
jgi:hypothetical protein